MGQPPSDPTRSAGKARILVVDDDPIIAELIDRVLSEQGYQVHRVGTAALARAAVEQSWPDLIVLDLILPDEDGLVLCSVFKTQARVQILVCSGTRRTRDEFLSLKLGADDFIAKPFDIYRFAARVEALLRRRGSAAAVEQPSAPGGTLQVDEVVIDEVAQTVSVAGRNVQLTPTELRLLLVLARRPGELIRRSRLTQLVWGQPTAGRSRTVDVHVGRLRAKLAQTHSVTPSIVSVRGLGYKLTLSTHVTTPASNLASSETLNPAATVANSHD